MRDVFQERGGSGPEERDGPGHPHLLLSKRAGMKGPTGPTRDREKSTTWKGKRRRRNPINGGGEGRKGNAFLFSERKENLLVQRRDRPSPE